jgi:hypothetical protein
MPANGTKRTCRSQRRTSAFGGIADIGLCLLYPQKRTLVERVGMSLCAKSGLMHCTNFEKNNGTHLQGTQCALSDLIVGARNDYGAY